jgi:hypothetical protein
LPELAVLVGPYYRSPVEAVEMTKRSAGKGHRFGGDWTDTKLDVIARYLESYTTALHDKPTKEHPFRKAYIDAFAGTGYRDARQENGSSKKNLCFPTLPGQNNRHCSMGLLASR